jgi:hypothetical protein
MKTQSGKDSKVPQIMEDCSRYFQADKEDEAIEKCKRILSGPKRTLLLAIPRSIDEGQ